MRTVEVTGYGGPEMLQLTERPDPQPAADRVRVRVAATCINPVDWYLRSGAMAAMLGELAPPFVLGFDLAGTALDDGPGVRAGQRVVGIYPWLDEQTGSGTNAEIFVADPAWLAAVPDETDLTAAATVPLNGLTAAQALHHAAVPDGGCVLITGASGGVGGFAVQLAVQQGLHVMAVASTNDEDHVRSLGAQVVLARDEAQNLAKADTWTPTPPVDAVIDAALSGQGLIHGVRDGGMFVTVLAAAAPLAERGIQVHALHTQPDRDTLTALAEDLHSGRLTTRIAGTLPLQDAADAHRHAEAGGLRGKLVLTL